MTRPFTYIVAWTKVPKVYIGVHFRKGCKPSDLWQTYFTSSKYVREARQLYGEPDVIETFEHATAEAAVEMEKELLKEFVLDGDIQMFLNRNVAGAVIPTEDIIEKHKQSTAIANKKRCLGKPSPVRGRKQTEEHKRKRGIYNGRPQSEETRKKLSELNKGKVLPGWVREKMREAHLGKSSGMKGKKHSVGTRQKISEALKLRNHANHN